MSHKAFRWIFKYSRRFVYWCVTLKDREMPTPKDVTIDVIIPVIPKDLKILPLCLEGIKENVSHTIDNIYLVAPELPEITSFCEANGLIFVEEKSVLGYGKEAVHFVTTKGSDRSGWIYQQLLKLSGKVGKSRHFLVIDADHILLRPHTFITSTDKLCFYQSREWHYPYYKNIKKLINRNAIHMLSYVAHKMIFDKESLAALRNEIERMNNQPWDKAIVQSLDKREGSSFSEYELYGTYTSPEQKVMLPWMQKAMKYDKIEKYDILKKKYKKYLSITFPEHYNKKAKKKG